MKRKCNCAGGCGPQAVDVTRRDFLGVMGAGAAAAAGIASGAIGAERTFEAPTDDLSRWKKSLFEPAAPRVYRSGVHKDARLHLGGIGTGNFEIGSDGQFTTWQLTNTLRDGHVPFHFTVRDGKAEKLLQTAGGPDGDPPDRGQSPRFRPVPVAEIEMVGEYPVAVLRFKDPDLAVEVELAAWSPFSPLDTRLSSMPLAAFVFKVRNPTAAAREVTLRASILNPIGYDAAGEIAGDRHPNFGGNVNEPFRAGALAGLFLRAEAGKAPSIDRPVSLLVGPNLKGILAPPIDRPKDLAVKVIDRPEAVGKPGKGAVIWLEEPGSDLSEAVLRAARAAAEAGSTLVFSGKTMPLIAEYAAVSGGKPIEKTAARPDIHFEDFEKGYGAWKVEGKAFGEKPPRGTLPSQQRVSGFEGKGLVNTFLEGDDTTGRATSKDFKIERKFIRFLVGGGRHRNTQIRLIVDGKAVRATAGKDDERLEPAAWNVAEFEGKTARIEIVDEQQGPWGHINVDRIEFSDRPGSMAALELLDEILPARFASLDAPVPKAGAARKRIGGGLEAIDGPLGEGRVVVVLGPILDPRQVGFAGARQRGYETICAIAGARYEGPKGALATAPGFGSMALAALAGKIADGGAGGPTAPGASLVAAVSSTVAVPAGATVEVPFLLAWHFPNKYSQAGSIMGCHYATLWPDARAVAVEAAEKFAEIRGRTEKFRKTFYDSTLPYWLLDCLTSQAAIIRHIGVVFRIADGDCYGWEGSNGCCQPTCTHVWGYEQTLSRLFPDLERIMRRIDFVNQQGPDGGVHNRTEVPSPRGRPTGERPFSDGHSSCILKAYREAMDSADDGFLVEYWPHIKKAVEYLIGRDAAAAKGEPRGYLQDDQWNTYDEALHGVTTFISGYYLAALRAGEEWAKRAGDTEAARRFHAIFERGQKNLVDLLWDGEYFRQELPGYEKMPGEVGPGCMGDQLIGQWWAHQLGLGYLFPKENVVAALKAVFKYNFKTDLTGWPHAPRAFAGEKDKGLIICTWPKGGRPGHVMLYSDEVWTGIEYQVAGHMIYEGMIEEAFAIVKGARDRYDGIPRPPLGRNPWNEIECGGHYARAMSSWSLLLGISGWEGDGPAKAVRFAPRWRPEDFRSFWCGPEGWGSASQHRDGGVQTSRIEVREGKLAVAKLRLEAPAAPSKVEVTAAGRRVEASFKVEGTETAVTLASPAALKEGEAIEARLS